MRQKGQKGQRKAQRTSFMTDILFNYKDQTFYQGGPNKVFEAIKINFY